MKRHLLALAALALAALGPYLYVTRFRDPGPPPGPGSSLDDHFVRCVDYDAETVICGFEIEPRPHRCPPGQSLSWEKGTLVCHKLKLQDACFGTGTLWVVRRQQQCSYLMHYLTGDTPLATVFILKNQEPNVWTNRKLSHRLPKQISGGLYDSYLGRSTTEKAQRGGTVVKSSVTYQRNAVSHLLLTNNFHFELKGIKLAPMAQLSLSLGRFLVPAAHTGKAEQGVVLLPAQLQFPVDERRQLPGIPESGMTLIAIAVDTLQVFLAHGPGSADMCFSWGRSFS